MKSRGNIILFQLVFPGNSYPGTIKIKMLTGEWKFEQGGEDWFSSPEKIALAHKKRKEEHLKDPFPLIFDEDEVFNEVFGY